jgi:hypothetical protein
MNQEDLENLLNKCLAELNSASIGNCESEKAEKNAALFLEMQIRLAEYLSSAELNAKMAKNEVERLSSQKYFEYKNGSILATENKGKLTEAALEHSVSKDNEVFALKEKVIKYEADYKKWNYIYNVLANGHILYRGMSRRDFNV